MTERFTKHKSLRLLVSLFSFVMIVSAIGHYYALFYVSVVADFILLHSVWLIPLARRGRVDAVDWAFFREVLAVFALSGLISALTFPSALQ